MMNKDFFVSNSDYIITVSTMIIGIIAGWLPNLKSKKLQFFINIILSALFLVATWLSYEELNILLVTIGVLIIWTGMLILVFFGRKGVIKRKKLDRMMRHFTSDADREQPICIFGGDLDFFGKCLKAPSHSAFFSKRKYKKEDISQNKQFLQLKNEVCFRTINILSVKPTSNNKTDIETRRRIGFLKEQLGESLTIKFFQSQECHDCDKLYECTNCETCSNCAIKTKCKHKIECCEKLKNMCSNMCFNPDTKLRGRFLQKKKDDSMCAAIVTTNKAGKSYILKEYTTGTKEYSIYRMIWDVWWRKCEEDENFINRCILEYKSFANDSQTQC